MLQHLSAHRESSQSEQQEDRLLRSFWRERTSEGEWISRYIAQLSTKRRIEEEILFGSSLMKIKRKKKAQDRTLGYA